MNVISFSDNLCKTYEDMIRGACESVIFRKSYNRHETTLLVQELQSGGSVSKNIPQDEVKSASPRGIITKVHYYSDRQMIFFLVQCRIFPLLTRITSGKCLRIPWKSVC